MRYYCKNCGSEIKTKFTQTDCPFCLVAVELIPDYETLEQYEKRTEEEFPAGGAVFNFDDRTGDWRVNTKFSACHVEYGHIVIASPPVPPPDDWRPE